MHSCSLFQKAVEQGKVLVQTVIVVGVRRVGVDFLTQGLDVFGVEAEVLDGEREHLKHVRWCEDDFTG